jgi:hypothetical protein
MALGPTQTLIIDPGGGLSTNIQSKSDISTRKIFYCYKLNIKLSPTEQWKHCFKILTAEAKVCLKKINVKGKDEKSYDRRSYYRRHRKFQRSKEDI